jgi:hypothetical protein
LRTARLLVFVLAASLCPAVAQANIWSWLEELSGPGPFHGGVVWIPVMCRDKPSQNFEVLESPTWHWCVTRVRVTTIKEEESKIKHPLPMVFAVKLGWLRSEDGPRFKDLPRTDPDNQGQVSVIPVSGLFLFRLHRSLDVGGGAGILRVSGKGFDPLYRVSLVPISASLTPLALNCKWQEKRWAYILRAEIESSFLPQGFKGSDFNNTRTSFKSGPEFLTRVGFVLDLGAAIDSFRRD